MIPLPLSKTPMAITPHYSQPSDLDSQSSESSRNGSLHQSKEGRKNTITFSSKSGREESEHT